jgi:lipoprotein LprG
MRTLYLALIVMLLAACGGQPAEPTAVPTPTPTPRELSIQIADATRAAPSFHFDVELAGAPVYADPNQIFTLLTMAGDLQRPDGVLASLRVSSVGGVVELRTVSLAGTQYLTNPITRQWQCVPPDFTFNPAVLFDPERGVEALIREGFENVSLVGLEELEGRPHYHLRGTFDGELLLPISAYLLGNGPVEADIWADIETRRAGQVVLVDTGTGSDEDEPSTWTLTFSEYGKEVDVRAPTEC